MLTNNFKKLLYFGNNGNLTDVTNSTVALSSFLQNATGTAVVNSHAYEGVVRSFNYTATSGSNDYTDEQGLYTWSGVCSSNTSNTPANGFILFVGSGNTAPTVDDYCLENFIELPVTSALCSQASVISTARTFYNNTENSVTINELGLYMFASRTNVSSAIPIVLLGRKVFANSVIIAPHYSYTFTYNVDMSDVTLNPV